MSHYGKIHEKHLRALMNLDDTAMVRGIDLGPNELLALQEIRFELSRLSRVKVKRAPGKKAKREKQATKKAAWKNEREKAFARARPEGMFLARCEYCHRAPAEHPHHLFGKPVRGMPEVAENILAVCAKCHDEIHAKQGTSEHWERIAHHASRYGYRDAEAEAVKRADDARLAEHQRSTLDAMRKAEGA